MLLPQTCTFSSKEAYYLNSIKKGFRAFCNKSVLISWNGVRRGKPRLCSRVVDWSIAFFPYLGQTKNSIYRVKSNWRRKGEVFLVFAVVFIITALIFFTICKRSNLFTLEAFTVWMFVTMLNFTINDIYGANLKWIESTKNIQMFCSLFIVRVFMIPFLFILFLDISTVTKSYLRKTGLILILVAVLVTLEYIVENTGMIKFKKWNALVGIVQYSCMASVVLGVRKFFWYLWKKGS